MQEIETLKAIEAIRKLKAKYCRVADMRDWHALAALFTVNGSMEFYEPSGELIAKVVGHQAIVERISGSVRYAVPIHHVFSAEIDVLSPTRAAAVWAMEDYLNWPSDDPSGKRTMHGFGHYHETYEFKDGSWLIATLRLTRQKVDFYSLN